LFKDIEITRVITLRNKVGGESLEFNLSMQAVGIAAIILILLSMVMLEK